MRVEATAKPVGSGGMLAPDEDGVQLARQEEIGDELPAAPGARAASRNL
jgi:hypothetical protein